MMPDLTSREDEPNPVEMHRRYRGKVQMIPKCTVRDDRDFAIWYTPGVAAPCRAIESDPNESYELTNRANSIAILSDGTRVLGLGNIGPTAGLPVMEGKALLFKVLGGIDAIPLCVRVRSEPPKCPRRSGHRVLRSSGQFYRCGHFLVPRIGNRVKLTEFRSQGMLLEEFNWKREVLESKEPVLVDFWAPWCPPCRTMNPVVQSLARDFKVCKVNVDKNQELAARYGVSSIPVFLILKGGHVVAHHLGVTSESTLRSELERLRSQ